MSNKRIVLAVPIIYMLLWSECNYHHALQLSKVPLDQLARKNIFLVTQYLLTLFPKARIKSRLSRT